MIYLFKALSLVKKNLLGFATFAPAWTYERRSKDEFLKLDRLFWCGTSNSKEIGVSKYMEDRSRPSADYFYSNFNQGYGYGLWFEGRKMLSGFWHHIGLQSVVPSLHLSESFVYSDKFQKDLIDVPEFTGLSWKVSTDCSFNGLLFY